MISLTNAWRAEVGKREGIEVGKKEGVLNTVRCLIADGTLPLEKIAAFAGLPYDEVKAIAFCSRESKPLYYEMEWFAFICENECHEYACFYCINPLKL